MNEASQAPRPPDRATRFVEYVIAHCNQDKGFAARLRRADNPATEYQSWDILATFGIPLEHENQRLAFLTVGASIARAKPQAPGTLPLGRAIAACYEKGSDSDPARTRLRRLLACGDIPEVCRIMRPQLTLIASKVALPLDYTRLLGQLLKFTNQSERIKAQWADEFYGQAREEAA